MSSSNVQYDEEIREDEELTRAVRDNWPYVTGAAVTAIFGILAARAAAQRS